MASRAFLIPLALACLALVAPSAQAGIDITVTGPDRAPEVTPGGSSSATVEIAITTTGNMVCPQAATVTLNLRAGLTDDSLGLSGAMTPESIDFEIPQGAWTDSTGQHSSDAVTASLSMTVDASKLPPGHPTHNLAATATWEGEAIGLCQGDSSSANPVSASKQVTFPIKQLPQEDTTAPGAGNGNNGGGGSTTPPPETGDDGGGSEESPAPGVLTIVIVALALAAMRRRQ